MKLVAALVVIAGCHRAESPVDPRTPPDECKESAHRETPTESCDCIRIHPQVAYPTPDSEVHAQWVCTKYSDAACRGAEAGKRCTSEGHQCSIVDGLCAERFACAKGIWEKVGERECAG